MSRHSVIRDGVRLVIFDADDTLRRTIVPGQPCPHAPEDWVLMPNVREVLRGIDWDALGIMVGVASNQDHVGYGLLEAALAERLLRDAISTATEGKVGHPIIRYCPHPREAGCACRKPEPGMLYSIMNACAVAANHTVFVGNSDDDAEAARRAGVRFVPAKELFGW